MARRKPNDEWSAIFNSLVLETEPPIEYVKNVIITTKSGGKFNVSPEDFEEILEREKLMGPELSMISSCKLALNMPKLKKDVNNWTNHMIESFDATGKAPVPTFAQEKRPVTPIKRKSKID
jgi:hypothetical protein